MKINAPCKITEHDADLAETGWAEGKKRVLYRAVSLGLYWATF